MLIASGAGGRRCKASGRSYCTIDIQVVLKRHTLKNFQNNYLCQIYTPKVFWTENLYERNIIGGKI